MNTNLYKIIEKQLFELVFSKNKYKNLENINIFFSGGTGFLGKWMLTCLDYIAHKNDYRISITLLSRKITNINKIRTSFNNLNLSFLKGDISKIIIKKKFDVIFHFAASSSKDENLNKIKVTDTIINGTINIIKNAERLNIKNLVFLSSGAVYGKHCKSNKGWKENDNISPDVSNPASTYGLLKKCSENLLINWAKNNKNNLLILRGFSFGTISESANSHFAFDNFIKKRANQENIIMNSCGKSKRNFMHPIDLCNWIFMSLPLKDISILNCGSKNNITLLDLAKKIAGIPIKGLQRVSFNSGNDNTKEDYIPNLCKSHALGYSEKISLNQQIKYSIYNVLEHNNIHG